MDFSLSPHTQGLLHDLRAFMDCYVLPHNAAWHQAAQTGPFPPPFIADLKQLAREAGLWNLCLPDLPADAPGTRLSNLAYAPLAEAMGRLPWASEVFNCHAPDSGNMELLLRFASPAQRERWLVPLLLGEIRSAFAMSEPDVASSDPTNLQTTVRRDGGDWVVNGRKWFITGAAHPQCRLLIVVCRHEDPAPLHGEAANPHHRHSLLLVPLDTPGVQVTRNIAVMHHLAPEGHCEILLRNVRVSPEYLLGQAGEGFAMTQARLGPGRIHHCMRTIGQCELALELAAVRALEREVFGQRVCDFSNVQNWLADSRLEIDQCRWMVLHTAWLLDQPRSSDPIILRHQAQQIRVRVSMIKVLAARLQTQVLNRAIQIFGAMGLSPDTPLASLWSWGRAMHLLDGPDEVHMRTVARHELSAARERAGLTADYFTTPEQMASPPRIRA